MIKKIDKLAIITDNENQETLTLKLPNENPTEIIGSAVILQVNGQPAIVKDREVK